MKKILFYLFVFQTLLFQACTDQENVEAVPEDKEKKVEVQFNVLANVKPSVPLKDLVNQVTIIVYKDSLEYYRQTQLNSDPSFGKFKIELPKANLRFVVIGSKTPFGINQYYREDPNEEVRLPFQSANFEYWQESDLLFEKRYKTDDTFFYSKEFKITCDCKEIDLTMERIVGRLEINVTNVDSFDVEMRTEDHGYRFAEQIPYGATAASYFINNKKSLVLYIMRTKSQLNLEISSQGKFQLLKVQVNKGKRTVVSGVLTDFNQQSGLSVTNLDTW